MLQGSAVPVRGFENSVILSTSALGWNSRKPRKIAGTRAVAP